MASMIKCKVYRIEHPMTGLGPYQSDKEYRSRITDAILKTHGGEWDKDHPHPSDDNMGLILEDYDGGLIFGFKDISQLTRWFDPALLDYLGADGYLIAVYDVWRKAMYFGSKQVGFDKRWSKRLHYKPLTDIS